MLLVACAPAAPAEEAAEPAVEEPTAEPTQAPTEVPTEASTATPVPVDPLEIGDPELGREIFEFGGTHENYKPQYFCSRCHSLDGSDGYGPSLKGISEVAGDRVEGLSAVEYLRQSIVEPDAYVIEGYAEGMGGIHRALLSDDEINNLIGFLLTQ
jgi:cytochrome c2